MVWGFAGTRFGAAPGEMMFYTLADNANRVYGRTREGSERFVITGSHFPVRDLCNRIDRMGVGFLDRGDR